MSHKVYLSGPIAGVAESEAYGWCEQFEIAMLLSSVYDIECFNPMRGKKSSPRVSHKSRYITERDRFDVHRSDLVVVNLLYSPSGLISIGTVIEMGWADAFRKPIIIAAYDNDVYLTHPIIEGITALIVDSVEDLIFHTKLFLSGVDPSIEPAVNLTEPPPPIAHAIAPAIEDQPPSESPKDVDDDIPF